ncbi:TRAP transporter large permease subunit [Hoeflea sp.]|uniref:TRAP transporter large permease subunit n=1 Tax=Hoeflea sp. TaxID=1940281 RepID=UPI0019A65922|nr:TRAP transporter large permease subunit [Hoeflea sp.]MBC7285303.1 TRAP transporter large permease subunit [Hoeflea sp.]
MDSPPLQNRLILYATSTHVLVLGVAAVYLVPGMCLDPLGIMLLTLPLVLPAFDALDINLIWMGILGVKFLEIGLITRLLASISLSCRRSWDAKPRLIRSPVSWSGSFWLTFAQWPC